MAAQPGAGVLSKSPLPATRRPAPEHCAQAQFHTPRRRARGSDGQPPPVARARVPRPQGGRQGPAPPQPQHRARQQLPGGLAPPHEHAPTLEGVGHLQLAPAPPPLARSLAREAARARLVCPGAEAGAHPPLRGAARGVVGVRVPHRKKPLLVLPLQAQVVLCPTRSRQRQMRVCQ
jgi:hypothetical protein